MARPLAALVLIAAAVGCGPEPRDYAVSVHNHYDQPMTLVLTKTGSPMEAKWLPPEDFAAMLHPAPELKVNGIVVQPGQTVSQTRHGEFDAGTVAVLRVYRGPQTLESMLGIGPTSPDRTDLSLAPGHNDVVIDAGGKATRQ